MSMPCNICDEYRTHDQDKHNEYYEVAISELRQKVNKLEKESK